MSYLPLKQLIGNQSAAQKAMRMIASGKIPQSLLITGPCSLAAQDFAKAFAVSLLTRQEDQGRSQAKLRSGNHPDLYLLHPEGKGNQYTIETIRQFNDLLVLPPTEALHKVFILLEAERMLPVSANALLKSIEEPARDAVVMLVSKAPKLLLPTLLSRCQTITLHPLADHEIALWLTETMDIDKALAQGYARLAEGSKGRARALASGKASYKETLLTLLHAIAQGHVTYMQIHEIAEHLADMLASQVKRETEKEKEKEKEKRPQAAEKQELESRSPQARHAQEKKEEGESASLLREAFNLLCIHILAYFRDLEAARMGVPTTQLYYPHLGSSLSTLSTPLSPYCPTLEQMESKIQAANALLDRFTPLKTCIEALFLPDTMREKRR